tara:strand:- start:40 stop:1443 length:1404 start_codon:yes stop_codon:yes gene_type:complete
MAQFSMNNLPRNLLGDPIPMQTGAKVYVGGRSVLDNIYGQSSNPSIQANPPSRFRVSNMGNRGLMNGISQPRRFSALSQSPAEKQAIINQSYTRNNLPVPNNNNIVSRQPGIATANNRTAKPNMMNSLLNYASSPQGKGMARGILEASGYSTMPKSFGEILAKGMQYSQENVNTELANKLAQRQLDIDEKNIKDNSTKDTAKIKEFKFYQDLNADQKKIYDQLIKNSPEFAYALAQARTSGEQGLSPGEKPLTAMQEAFDKTSATELANFMSKEYPGQITNLQKFDDVIAQLKNNPNLTGAVEGGMPFALKVILNPESIGVQDDIQSIIFQQLKATLGAQFTEMEGKNLVKANFNPFLSEEINIKRLERLRAETVRGLENKVAMFRHMQNGGSLRDWDGGTFGAESLTLDKEVTDKNASALQQSLYSLDDYSDKNSDQLLEMYNSKDISEAEKTFIYNNLKALGISE